MHHVVSLNVSLHCFHLESWWVVAVTPPTVCKWACAWSLRGLPPAMLCQGPGGRHWPGRWSPTWSQPEGLRPPSSLSLQQEWAVRPQGSGRGWWARWHPAGRVRPCRLFLGPGLHPEASHAALQRLPPLAPAGPSPPVDHTSFLQPAGQHDGHGHHPAVQRVLSAELVLWGPGGRSVRRPLSAVQVGGGRLPRRRGSTGLHLPPGKVTRARISEVAASDLKSTKLLTASSFQGPFLLIVHSYKCLGPSGSQELLKISILQQGPTVKHRELCSISCNNLKPK